LVVLSQKQ